MCATEIENYRRDSKRSLSEFRLRKHMDSKLATMIIFFAMPIYMIGGLSAGKRMTILAAISISVMSITSIYA